MGIAVLIRCATAQPFCPPDWVQSRSHTTEISSVFGISKFGHSRILWSQTQSLAILQTTRASTAPITECHVWYHCSRLTVQKRETLSSEVPCPTPTRKWVTKISLQDAGEMAVRNTFSSDERGHKSPSLIWKLTPTRTTHKWKVGFL